MAVTPTTNRARSRSPRTKSGCRTCKIRKVKCDETWPICSRCQSTGRHCDGYGIWGGGSKAHDTLQNKPNCQTSSRNPSHTQDLALISLPKAVPLLTFENKEQRTFDWFVNHSTGKLYGAFFSNSWTTLLFQATTTEPAIRHAVLALGSAHREEVLSANTNPSLPSCDDSLTLFTVKQYSIAINRLEPCFSNSKRESIHILLISCALFVPMEFLRGNYPAGVLHLDHGLQLLHEIAVDHNGEDRSVAHIDGWLITILTRHVVQAKLLGQKFKTPCRSLLSPLLHADIDTFRSIHHARRGLENIMLLVFDFEEQASRTMVTDQRSCNIDSQKALHTQLQLWSKIAENTLTQLAPTHTFIDCFAYRLLRLYHEMASILVNTSVNNSEESSFDQCQHLFLNIVVQCISIYKIVYSIARGADNSECTGKLFSHYHSPMSTSGQSVSDIGWIAPLYFTAVKCRNPRIRKQALLLLQTTGHKEGIWDANLVSIVASKVIEMEEGDFYTTMKIEEDFDRLAEPSAQDLTRPTLPAELRLSNLNILLPENKQGTLSLTCSRTDSSGAVKCIKQMYDLPSHEWYEVS